MKDLQGQSRRAERPLSGPSDSGDQLLSGSSRLSRAAKQNSAANPVAEDRTRDSVRIWVPGCSSGEEAYSIAICLLENLGDRASSTSIQIFASDISEQAIDKARARRLSQRRIEEGVEGARAAVLRPA